MSTSFENSPEEGVIPAAWLDRREAAAWRGYLDMSAVLMARLGRELQRHSGLSQADYGVLVELSEDWYWSGTSSGDAVTGKAGHARLGRQAVAGNFAEHAYGSG